MNEITDMQVAFFRSNPFQLRNIEVIQSPFQNDEPIMFLNQEGTESLVAWLMRQPDDEIA